MTQEHKTISREHLHAREREINLELQRMQGYQNPVEARNHVILLLAFHGSVFAILSYLLLIG